MPGALGHGAHALRFAVTYHNEQPNIQRAWHGVVQCVASQLGGVCLAANNPLLSLMPRNQCLPAGLAAASPLPFPLHVLCPLRAGVDGALMFPCSCFSNGAQKDIERAPFGISMPNSKLHAHRKGSESC